MQNFKKPHLAWILIFFVTLSAAYAIISIHKKAEINSGIEIKLLLLNSYATKAAAIEWKALASSVVTENIKNEFNITTKNMQDILTKIPQSDDDKDLKALGNLIKEYTAAVNQEFYYIEEKNLRAADSIDALSIDPKMTLIISKIKKIDQKLKNKSETLHKVSSAGIISTALIAAILISLLLMYLQKSREREQLIKTEQRIIKFSEERLKMLIENASDVILLIDKNGEILYISESSKMVLGLSPSLLLNKTLFDIFNKQVDQELESLLLSCCNDPGNTHILEISYQAPRKENKHLKIIAKCPTSPIIEGIIINLRDVTEPRRYQQEIREQERFLSNIFCSIQDCLTVTDKEFNILRVNPIMESLYQSQSPIVGKKCYEVCFGKSAPCHDCYSLKTIHEGKPAHKVIVKTNEQGEDRYIEHFAFPYIESRTSETEGIIHYSRDITEKVNLEKEMARYESLNLIGEIAASIAHEIRNPMTTVRGFLQLFHIRRETIDKEHINIMIDELDRANSIITEFLSLAKNRAIAVKKQDLNSIIQSLAPLIKADAISLDKKITFKLGQIAELYLDEKEIRQLILNLVRNGLEAMPEGGGIYISTYQSNNEVVLAVQDEGKGIKPQLLDKLGTPFLTTKDHGTGLGLAVCFSITARHNAKIDVDTGPRGTTFLIKFPLDVATV